jgi:hypothetical protein
MTRRIFLCSAALAGGMRAAELPLILPLRCVMDSRAQCTPEQLRTFWWKIWPEAIREFHRGGIQFQVSDAIGEIRRSPAGRPIFKGLERGTINLLITDHIPQDYGGLAGVSTLHEGYHLCVIALSGAHANQVPYFSVNTCVHELLHLLMQDVYLTRPKWYQTGDREFRIDRYATRLWLFGDGEAVRKSGVEYQARLRAGK